MGEDGVEVLVLMVFLLELKEEERDEFGVDNDGEGEELEKIDNKGEKKVCVR